MHDSDTICAVSTPPGEGGIGIIRISGQAAVPIASSLFRPKNGTANLGTESHRILYGHIVAPGTDEPIDEVLVSVMLAPTTYTREDVVEINCHGGMQPLSRTLGLLIAAGARQAEPGEFTKRAFLNGRIDLSQAEAVMDIIRARTELSHKAANELLLGGLSREIAALREKLIKISASVEAAVDFPEDEIETDTGKPLHDEVESVICAIDRMLVSVTEGRILREGFATAIVGRPNVGKSSLLNALLRQNRAIVTDVPGTTRDVLEEYLNISGVPLRIVDTAGIRHTEDIVEQEGVRRSLAAIESADIVLVVLDGSMDLTEEDQRVLNGVQGKPCIAVINKSDLPRKLRTLRRRSEKEVMLSCRTGAGLDELRKALSDLVLQGAVPGTSGHAWTINRRHQTALEQARESLCRVSESIAAGLSPEFIAVDLRTALDQLGIVIGVTCTEDILERIFSDFCIGK